jgi:hypothetical protein
MNEVGTYRQEVDCQSILPSFQVETSQLTTQLMKVGRMTLTRVMHVLVHSGALLAVLALRTFPEGGKVDPESHFAVPPWAQLARLTVQGFSCWYLTKKISDAWKKCDVKNLLRQRQLRQCQKPIPHV